MRPYRLGRDLSVVIIYMDNYNWLGSKTHVAMNLAETMSDAEEFSSGFGEISNSHGKSKKRVSVHVDVY